MRIVTNASLQETGGSHPIGHVTPVVKVADHIDFPSFKSQFVAERLAISIVVRVVFWREVALGDRRPKGHDAEVKVLGICAWVKAIIIVWRVLRETIADVRTK